MLLGLIIDVEVVEMRLRHRGGVYLLMLMVVGILMRLEVGHTTVSFLA